MNTSSYLKKKPYKELTLLNEVLQKTFKNIMLGAQNKYVNQGGTHLYKETKAGKYFGHLKRSEGLGKITLEGKIDRK